jgi:hypothetical protein
VIIPRNPRVPTKKSSPDRGAGMMAIVAEGSGSHSINCIRNRAIRLLSAIGTYRPDGALQSFLLHICYKHIGLTGLRSRKERCGGYAKKRIPTVRKLSFSDRRRGRGMRSKQGVPRNPRAPTKKGSHCAIESFFLYNKKNCRIYARTLNKLTYLF